MIYQVGSDSRPVLCYDEKSCKLRWMKQKKLENKLLNG